MRFFILLLFLPSFASFAQPACSGPGRTAETATVICTESSFFQQDLSDCDGPSIPSTGCTLGHFYADDAAWYRFHCFQSGTLGFLITPLGNDDYDWAVFDITGRPVSDIKLYETNDGFSFKMKHKNKYLIGNRRQYGYIRLNDSRNL